MHLRNPPGPPRPKRADHRLHFRRRALTRTGRRTNRLSLHSKYGLLIINMAITLDTQFIVKTLEQAARNFPAQLGLQEIGHVIEAGDGIARIDGLPGVMTEEMLLFPHGVHGLTLNLDINHVGAIILGDQNLIQQGDVVQRTGRVLEVPVGDALLGRVVTPLGDPIDGRGPIIGAGQRQVEMEAPGIADREPVNAPIQTGLKSIDAMTAIGRGQRELIIGDRQTGKTTVAVDTLLNQGPDVRCVYVAIGQKMSSVAATVEILRAHNVLQNCIVVVASASDAAPLQYIAPFAGCAMAEHFRDSGKHALIVYDDLSKHSVAYREISLLLRRPPGREAFPGDIFYLHSRLLERACKLSARHGGGSLTALPIVETKEGDYAAYIPTNLISITDGQIYMESALFHQGFRPAVNAGLSVSRVGGKAQINAMRKASARLRIELALARETAAFAQLTTDIDATTMRQLQRAQRLTEILKQPAHEPMRVDKEVCILWAATHGWLDEFPLASLSRLQEEWFRLLDNSWPQIGRSIMETGDLSTETLQQIEASFLPIKMLFAASGAPASTAQPKA